MTTRNHWTQQTPRNAKRPQVADLKPLFEGWGESELVEAVDRISKDQGAFSDYVAVIRAVLDQVTPNNEMAFKGVLDDQVISGATVRDWREQYFPAVQACVADAKNRHPFNIDAEIQEYPASARLRTVQEISPHAQQMRMGGFIR